MLCHVPRDSYGAGLYGCGVGHPDQQVHQQARTYQAENRVVLALRAYRMYCFSTLQVYLQFYDVTDEVRDLENRAIKIILAGPHAWMAN